MFARISTRSCARLPPRRISKSVFTQVLYRNASSSSSSSPKIGDVHFDQTKKNNDPEEKHTVEHAESSKYAEMDGSGVHPAKEMDPEQETSRSTGIKSEGQGKQAGEGKNENVHKETKGEPGPNMTWGGKQ